MLSVWTSRNFCCLKKSENFLSKTRAHNCQSIFDEVMPILAKTFTENQATAAEL